MVDGAYDERARPGVPLSERTATVEKLRTLESATVLPGEHEAFADK